MIQTQLVRELTVHPAAADTGAHLAAASGLVRRGRRLYVVADDALHLGLFDLDDAGPGALWRLLPGSLPAEHEARKAAKPDWESLLLLQPTADAPHGGLLALGSGSKRRRQRAEFVPLDAAGLPGGAPLEIDLTAWFDALRPQFGKLNVEGAFVDGAELCLLQRGNKGLGLNACVRFELASVQHWLFAGGTAPACTRLQTLELGQLGGVPLGFTDGAALPGGGWVFCAAAEDTDDSVADGRCLGSTIGVVDAAGVLRSLQPLARLCKTEGIALAGDDADSGLLLVTDADDRAAPAVLLSAPRPG